MSTSLFERLVNHLTAIKQAKEQNQSLTFEDFAKAVGQLKNELPEIHNRLIRGSKLSRRDADKEALLVKQLFRFVREMQLEAGRETDLVRQAALKEQKIVYVPRPGNYLQAKNPEEP